jgi:[ribosomal protein S5]-alanine N-acetyltransferase
MLLALPLTTGASGAGDGHVGWLRLFYGRSAILPIYARDDQPCGVVMLMIETSRLLLRDFVEADWEAVESMLSDPETTRYMHFSSWAADQRQRWFTWCLANSQLTLPDATNWAIIDKAHATIVGWLGIGRANHPTVAGERDCGYLLARPHWGHGYMTEALRAVIAYEFTTLCSPYISATCETANRASARVMEKAGMRWIQTVYDSDFAGNWAERHHYGISHPNHSIETV